MDRSVFGTKTGMLQAASGNGFVGIAVKLSKSRLLCFCGFVGRNWLVIESAVDFAVQPLGGDFLLDGFSYEAANGVFLLRFEKCDRELRPLVGRSGNADIGVVSGFHKIRRSCANSERENSGGLREPESSLCNACLPTLDQVRGGGVHFRLHEPQKAEKAEKRGANRDSYNYRSGLVRIEAKPNASEWESFRCAHLPRLRKLISRVPSGLTQTQNRMLRAIRSFAAFESLGRRSLITDPTYRRTEPDLLSVFRFMRFSSVV